MRLSDTHLLLGVLITYSALSAAAQNGGESKELFSQAVDAQKRGDYGDAVRQYRELVKVTPGLLPAWVNLGVSLVQMGRYQDAVQSYRTALALDPHNRQIEFYLALAYFKSGDAANASREFEELLRSDPTDIRAATLLAASDLQTGDSARALAVLAPLSSSAGDDPDFLWSLAMARIANGKLREGISSAEKVGLQTNSAAAWKLAGENLLLLDEFPQAKADLETAVRLNPALPGLQTVLGQAREKNADYGEAVEAFHKAVEQNPKDFAAWLGLGSNEYFLRDLEGARASLETALTLNPRSAPALYARALVDKREGRLDASIAGLEQAVSILPTWTEAHVQLAALYMQVHRAAEGARERELVDQLNEAEREAGPAKY